VSAAPATPERRAEPRAIAAARAESPLFLPLGPVARLAFLFYLFAYRIVFPVLAATTKPGAMDLFELRFLAELFYTCLLAYPFIFSRKEYGWLHPLVLPVLWELGKALAKNPMSLFFPFEFPQIDFAVETSSRAAVLSMSNTDLAWYRLESTLMYGLAQASYLAMFLFGPTFKVPRWPLRRPASVALPAMIFIGGLLALAAVFVIAKGGLSEMLVAMRGGRRALFEGYGQYVTAAQLAPMIALIWFAYEKKPFTNPLFLGGFVASLLTSLVVSGSRSSIILPALTFVLLWWWRRGRVMALPTLAAAFIGLVIVGGFGSIRQDYGSTSVDLSVFNLDQVGTTIGRAYTEIGRRDDEDSTVAVMVGADRKGFLWGRSYVNAATFWVPRALWPGKPAGVDVYNMWINFNDNKIGDTPPNEGSWGIPVDGEAEAYWNFGWAGVVLVFVLLGAFHATLAKAARLYRYVPIFWVVYIYTVLNVNATSRSVADMFKVLALILVFALLSGIIRWGKDAKVGRAAPASAA
jgi:hypothetical protein